MKKFENRPIVTIYLGEEDYETLQDMKEEIGISKDSMMVSRIVFEACIRYRMKKEKLPKTSS